MSDNGNFRKIVYLVIGTVFLIWGLFNYAIVLQFIKLLYGFIFPFVLGGCMAYILNIPMRSIEKLLIKIFTFKKKPPKLKHIRPWSIIITLIIFFSVIVGVLFIVIPQVGDTLLSIKEELPHFVAQCQKLIQSLSFKLPDFAEGISEFSVDWEKIVDTATSMISKLGTAAVSSSLSLATSVFSGIVNFILSFILAIYILAGKEKISVRALKAANAFIPEKIRNKSISLLKLINSTFSGFISGQCIEAVILGLLIFIGMLIFGFPYAALVSVLVAVTALIPIFGAFISCFLGAFLILVQSPIDALWFVIFFFVIQQIEGNLIYPRVVGSKVGLPPILVLIAVTLGGGMFGVAGMLFFIPSMSVIYTLFNEYTEKKGMYKEKPKFKQ